MDTELLKRIRALAANDEGISAEGTRRLLAAYDAMVLRTTPPAKPCLDNALKFAQSGESTGGDATHSALAILAAEVMSAQSERKWLPIETAPKNGDEILGFRDDCGIMLMRWIAPCDFLTDREIESMDLIGSETEDWFCADFVSGGRLDGDLAPTHWHPLPALPNAKMCNPAPSNLPDQS